MAKIFFGLGLAIYSGIMHATNSIDTNTLVLALCIALSTFAAGIDDYESKE